MNTKPSIARRKQRKTIAALRGLKRTLWRSYLPGLDWLLDSLALRPLTSVWRLISAPVVRRSRRPSYRYQILPQRAIASIEILEARALLTASYSQIGNTLNISLDDSQLVTVDAIASGYTFTLTNSSATNSWQGSANGWVSTNGATLTVNAQGYAGLSAIAISDTSTAAGAAVNFGNSGANLYQAGLSVDLERNPGSVGFTGTTSMSGVNSLSVTTARDVIVNSGARVEAVDGNLSFLANTQAVPTAGAFTGITVSGLVYSTGVGSMTLTGVGGTSSTGSSSWGVSVKPGAQIVGGTSGPLQITGTGGAGSATQNVGVMVGDLGNDSGGLVDSNNSNVIVQGTGGGSAASSTNVGIWIGSGGVQAGGSGSVSLSGTGGNRTGTGNDNYGVLFYGYNASLPRTVVAQGGGNVTISGAEGGGANSVGIFLESFSQIVASASPGVLTLEANSMCLFPNNGTPASSIDNFGVNGNVILQPLTPGVGLNLGSSSDPIGGPLGLSTTEMSLVSAATVSLGSTTAGTVTISSGITHTSGISDLVLLSGPTAGVQPSASGTDLNLGVNTTTLGSGSPLLINISGTVVDSGYNQLRVSSAVNLVSSPLVLQGSFTTALHEAFTIVNAPGGVTGTFKALPNHSFETWKGRALQIGYAATTVALTDVGPATTTTLATSVTSVVAQSPVTFTATVTLGATGSVAFYDGNTLLATLPLAGTSNTATFSTTALTAGTHVIIAVYEGDAAHGGSNSGSVTQTVLTPTTILLATSAASAAALSSVTFTATVTAGATGSVKFYDGTTLLGTAALSGTKATVSTTTLAVGTHSISAVYQGDADYTSSTSATVTETITALPTTTVLSASTASTAYLSSVTFKATVTDGATGSVKFYDGTTLLGTAALSGTTATFSTTTLAVGSHPISAVYQGDADYAQSTSATVTETITALSTTTALATSAASAAALSSVTFTATVTAGPCSGRWR
ncbi:MAG: Ig-like domain-containing protein [Planctomycetota bacterium]|nr:Ig-like domain-containing protein [Planctomycetota bacterium]